MLKKMRPVEACIKGHPFAERVSFILFNNGTCTYWPALAAAFFATIQLFTGGYASVFNKQSTKTLFYINALNFIARINRIASIH